MRRLIVKALLAACNITDTLGLDRITHRHRLADWSADLDERWNTGVWEKASR